jgi:hypothetical protein
MSEVPNSYSFSRLVIYLHSAEDTDGVHADPSTWLGGILDAKIRKVPEDMG